MQIEISNGHIIDPANQIDVRQNLYIADGKVVALEKPPAGFKAEQTINAKGSYVIPGLVDLCARLREPGHENKGNIKTETHAAAAGGVTTLCMPPDTEPCIDTPAIAELIYKRAQDAGYCNVVTLGALTQDLAGEHLSELSSLKLQGGVVGVSNALQPLKNILVMRRAMEYAASCNIAVFLHAEDKNLANNGCAHEGTISTRLGIPAIPESAETAAVSRDLMLIEQTGVRAHFCHISSVNALHMIAQAKQKGLPVSVDVTAHHLHLIDQDIGFFNSDCHVKPPLRSQRDRDGLRQGLKDNLITAICSDHQPHDADAKLAPFVATEPGISSIETLLPLGLRLVNENILSLPELVKSLTSEPASILGIDKGQLGIGSDADICIFDPKLHWTVNNDTLFSAGKNTPFHNWELQGRVTHTLLAGNPVYTLEL